MQLPFLVLCLQKGRISLTLLPQDKEDQWMTKLVPGVNDFAMLQPLQWNTRYEVEITARNVKGLSEPTFYQFFMPQKPDITGKAGNYSSNTSTLLLLLNSFFFLVERTCCVKWCFAHAAAKSDSIGDNKGKESKMFPWR